jgi:uncharacterized protein (DUF427 family)
MMKKRMLVPALVLLLSGLAVWAFAAGGDASDPLVSLSYLNGTYASTVDAKVDEKLNASDQALLAAANQEAAGAAFAETWTEQRLKEGDVLSGSTGLHVMVLAGKVTVSFSGGAVVDVSTGNTVTSGTSLTADHRYLVAEDTNAAFTVTSQTAVVDYQGYYSVSQSDAVDYNAMAAALKVLHLFRGSSTGYGQGFDLEAVPTRLQALIMFIRVLGEEEAALAWEGTSPFTDLVKGSDAAKYVGYAYEKGYTNGYTATQWRPGQSVNVYQYTEFILRALGYSSVATSNLATTMERARDCGLLTAGEVDRLKTTTFLRAQLVYISYRALESPASGTGVSLGDTLIAKGIYTAAEAAEAKAMVSDRRLS